MKHKGLSQILYLIIAASVLMMIAMVITFTATDTIGGLGGSAEDTACGDALKGQCVATNSPSISVPSTCVSQDQWVETFLQSSVYEEPNNGGSTISAANYNGDGYVLCSVVPN